MKMETLHLTGDVDKIQQLGSSIKKVESKDAQVNASVGGSPDQVQLLLI